MKLTFRRKHDQAIIFGACIASLVIQFHNKINVLDASRVRLPTKPTFFVRVLSAIPRSDVVWARETYTCIV